MFYFKSQRRRVAVNLDYRFDPNSSGKWVVFGSKGYIGNLFKRARESVRDGDFYEVKSMKVRNGRYALLVYADRDTKESFLDILRGLSLNPLWVSNSQTRVRRRIKGLMRKLTSGF